MFSRWSGTVRWVLEQEQLPLGWEQRTTGDGRIYYVCHDTRTSQVIGPLRRRIVAANLVLQSVCVLHRVHVFIGQFGGGFAIALVL